MLAIGNHLDVVIEDIAHGGMGIARSDGVVIFIPGTDIGERVQIEVTKIGSKGRFVFADIIKVIESSSHRIDPPCQYAGICGGCDFQHIRVSRQRELKKNVILNSLQKFAGIDPTDWASLEVQALAELHYRTRMHYQSTPTGEFGLFRAKSNAVVLIDECEIASSEVACPQDDIGVVADDFQGFVKKSMAMEITERVGKYVYHLDTHCFWQAHREAPQRFLEIVMRLANIQRGDSVWDLYSGVGLFTLPSSECVGEEGSVIAVEGDKRSARYLTANTAGITQAHAINSDVEQWVKNTTAPVEVVILDPPRKGAGKAVMELIIERQPRVVVYVGCDPVALSRDIGIARSLGYELKELEAVDAFPQTHHVETFALLAQTRIDIEEKA
ncbi:MAG: class I SAM-dependent RNA methyltransferase [Candidatus Nanopelagicales bacterium]